MESTILLMYPPGPPYQRGESRSQGSVHKSTATSVRACNDLGYCAAVLEKAGYRVMLRDYQTEKKTWQDLKLDVQTHSPQMVMISITNATIFEDITVAGRIKDLCGAVTVLKGALFYDSDMALLDLLDLEKIDFLIGGEEEAAITPIADYVLGRPEKAPDDISAVNNIFYKNEEGRFVKNSFQAWMKDLDALPFPARHLMNNALYVRPDTNMPMATIQTSRGCSSSCSFCLSPALSGKKVRYRSPENVMQEIKACYDQFNIRNFFFRADTFTLHAEWSKQLCELILASELNGKIAFTVNSRTNPIDRETLFLLKKAGCFVIAFGFESGSDDTLRRIRKGSTVADNLQAARWAQEAGLAIFGFYMVGFPWETHAHLKETRRHIFEIDADFIEVHAVIPYYGTDLYRQCVAAGTLAQSSLGHDYFDSSINGTKYLDRDELEAFRQTTIRSYHLRPGYLARRVMANISNPKVLINYGRYGLKMIRNTRS